MTSNFGLGKLGSSHGVDCLDLHKIRNMISHCLASHNHGPLIVEYSTGSLAFSDKGGNARCTSSVSG